VLCGAPQHGALIVSPGCGDCATMDLVSPTSGWPGIAAALLADYAVVRRVERGEHVGERGGGSLQFVQSRTHRGVCHDIDPLPEHHRGEFQLGCAGPALRAAYMPVRRLWLGVDI